MGNSTETLEAWKAQINWNKENNINIKPGMLIPYNDSLEACPYPD